MDSDHNLLEYAVHELRNVLVPALERLAILHVASEADVSDLIAARRGIEQGLAVADRIAVHMHQTDGPTFRDHLADYLRAGPASLQSMVPQLMATIPDMSADRAIEIAAVALSQLCTVLTAAMTMYGPDALNRDPGPQLLSQLETLSRTMVAAIEAMRGETR